MTPRVGTCTSCEARFKVPDTVTASRARCKKCGGVVEIPPPEATPTPMPDEAPEAPQAPEVSEAPEPERPRRAAPRRGSGRAARERKTAVRGSRPGRKGAASHAARSARSRRETAAPGRSPLVLWGGVGGGVVLLSLGAWRLLSGDDDPQPVDTGGSPAISEPEAAGAPEGTEGAAAEVAEPSVEPAPGPDPEPLPVPDPAETAADTGPDEGPDTTALEDLAPLDSTSPEEWTRMMKDVDTVLNDRGAPGGRALTRLVGQGRAAFPAIVNALKSFDLSDPQAMLDAYPVVRALEELTGKSMTWKSAGDPDQVRYNRKAVALWHKQWDILSRNERNWMNFTKRVTASAGQAGDEGDGEIDPEELLDDL